MKSILILLLVTLFIGCSEKKSNEKPDHSPSVSTSDRKNRLTYKVIKLDGLGWGYQIFRGAKIEINQEHIPAVNGLFGFSSEGKAEIAAKFVIQKMKEDWDRPTVKAEELDSIGAINLDSLKTISQKSID